MSNDQQHNTSGANLSVSDVSLEVAGVAETAYGEPIVSSISGTFGQGNTITISGSNFSANRSAPIISENFESGVAGAEITDISSFTLEASSTPEHVYKYTTEDSFSGSKSAKLDFVAGSASALRPQFDLGENLNKVFVTMRVKVVVVAEPHEDSQMKIARLIPVSNDHTSTPHVSITNLDGVMVWEDDGDGNVSQRDGASVSDGVWQNIIMYIDLGDTDTRNGSRFIKAYGVDSYSTWDEKSYVGYSNDGVGADVDTTSWIPQENVICKTSSADAQFLRYLLIPFYKQPTDSYEIYVDQVYANSSLECVFISPHSTWSVAKANSDELITQGVISRASTEISIGCETGDLASGGYLYVMNASGEANASGVAI